MTSWRASTWGDEVTLEYGKALRGYEAAIGPVRVYGSNGPVGWTDKALSSGPGVILGRKGAYRGIQYSEGDFFVIDTAYYVVPKSDLDMRWLYYAIQYHKLGEIDDGSPVPSTTRAAVYVRDLEVPPKNVQIEVARVLGEIDDKIALNRRINQTLEAMAQAIFKSWFVDFDPVKAKITAKAEGRDPLRAAMTAISGKPDDDLDALPPEQYEQIAATAALFPEEMEESELGEIPKGWIVSDMRKLAEVISKGTTPNKSDLANAKDVPTVPFVKVKDISKNGEIARENLELIARSIHESSLKRSVLKTDDLLFSIAGTIGRTAFVDNDLNGANVNQAIAFIRLKEKLDHFALCWLTLRSIETKNFIASKVVQAVQANASLANVGDTRCGARRCASSRKSWRGLAFRTLSP